MKRFVVMTRDVWCNGCGYCVLKCPTENLWLEKSGWTYSIKVGDNCIGCKECEIICPRWCIWIIKERCNR